MQNYSQFDASLLFGNSFPVLDGPPEHQSNSQPVNNPHDNYDKFSILDDPLLLQKSASLSQEFTSAFSGHFPSLNYTSPKSRLSPSHNGTTITTGSTSSSGTSQKDKRAEQNRRAQRNFRLKKKRYIEELEMVAAQMIVMRKQLQDMTTENEQLRAIITHLNSASASRRQQEHQQQQQDHYTPSPFLSPDPHTDDGDIMLSSGLPTIQTHPPLQLDSSFAPSVPSSLLVNDSVMLFGQNTSAGAPSFTPAISSDSARNIPTKNADDKYRECPAAIAHESEDDAEERKSSGKEEESDDDQDHAKVYLRVQRAISEKPKCRELTETVVSTICDLMKNTTCNDSRFEGVPKERMEKFWSRLLVYASIEALRVNSGQYQAELKETDSSQNQGQQ